MLVRPQPEAAAIVCEIFAARAAIASALADIAVTCAKDVGQHIAVKTLCIGCTAKQSSLTLHLPAELAARQHRIWCLACRLACFCPDARVSVLVHGEAIFAQTTASAASRRSRCA